MKAYELKIHGLVQGVFFRKHTLQKAGEFGIFGYVKNCKDGSVEVFAEGEEEKLQNFIRWCHQGPGKAKVTGVDIHERPLKNSQVFIIAR